METVWDHLQVVAKEDGLTPEQFAEYRAVWLGAHIAPTLPDRYRRLVQEVLWRLPAEWDTHATWSVETSQEPKPRGYGSALRQEEEEGDREQLWVVTLYPALLDRLSDAACRWAIAHELAHVASGIPTGSVEFEGKAYTRIKGTVDQYQEASSKIVHEDAADQIALDWGFSEELQALLAEDC